MRESAWRAEHEPARLGDRSGKSNARDTYIERFVILARLEPAGGLVQRRVDGDSNDTDSDDSKLGLGLGLELGERRARASVQLLPGWQRAEQDSGLCWLWSRRTRDPTST